MDIGNFVRLERKRQGMTQQQLAAKSGVGLNFVYQLEKNKASVQLDSVNQVLRVLGYQVGVMRDFRPWVESKPDLSENIQDEFADFDRGSGMPRPSRSIF